MLHLKRVCSSSTRLPELFGPETAQKAGPTEPASLWGTRETQPERLGLGSAHNAGPAPWRAAWSLSSVDGKAHTRGAGANPVWPEHSSAPHTRQGRLPAAPLPPRSTAEQANLDKRPPPPPVSGRKSDTKRPANRSQINKGNRFRSDRCNRIKSL